MSDFDFLVGSWQVHNRRRVKPLADCDEWQEFVATSMCTPLLGGAGNIDEFTFPTDGLYGLTLRLFDPQSRQWSLYWASSRDGRLQPPVVGAFSGDRGVFLGDDSYQGRPIRVRYIWSACSPRAARWEQAFAVDGDRSWETNWIMELSRSTD